MKKVKGNPAAQMRYHWKLFTVDTDEPLDGYWEQLKGDAIKTGVYSLVREFEKFGTTNILLKVFNEMNHKEKPVVITLDEARILVRK